MPTLMNLALIIAEICKFKQIDKRKNNKKILKLIESLKTQAFSV